MEDPPISSSSNKRISSLLKKSVEPFLSSSQSSLSAYARLQSPCKRKTKEIHTKHSTDDKLELGLSDLPTEIIFNILSRLPSKSLCRLQLVSTKWLALIADPQFIKSHFHQSIKDNDMNHKLILGSRRSSSIYYVDYESPDHSSVELEMLFNCRIRCVFFLGSFNGTSLLEIGMSGSEDYQFCLWNPSIGMSQTFSEPIYSAGFYGLGYDFVTDDFKVVWAGYSENGLSPVHVFSSKIGSWRRIGDFDYKIEYHVNTRETVFKGMPHWLVGRNRYGITTTVIVCFDVTKEKFMEVPRPSYGAENDSIWLGVLGGWLCMVDYRSTRGAVDHLGTLADVWVMKEYGVKQSWTKLFVVPLAYGEFYFDYFEVLCFTTDGDVVMSLNCQKLVVYNLKRNSYRRIDPKVCRQLCGESGFTMDAMTLEHL